MASVPVGVADRCCGRDRGALAGVVQLASGANARRWSRPGRGDGGHRGRHASDGDGGDHRDAAQRRSHASNRRWATAPHRRSRRDGRGQPRDVRPARRHHREGRSQHAGIAGPRSGGTRSWGALRRRRSAGQRSRRRRPDAARHGPPSRHAIRGAFQRPRRRGACARGRSRDATRLGPNGHHWPPDGPWV